MSEFRNKIIKEITIHHDCVTSLEWLINQYNRAYPELNIKEEDFSIRVSKSPEEACYISTVITISKSEETLNKNEVMKLSSHYDKLLKNAFDSHNELMNPYNICNLTWDYLEELYNRDNPNDIK